MKIRLSVVTAAAAIAAATTLRGNSQYQGPASDANLRPIIGILSLPSEESAWNGKSYFAASYVKWIESGGARVVPLPYTQPDQVQAMLPVSPQVTPTAMGAAA